MATAEPEPEVTAVYMTTTNVQGRFFVIEAELEPEIIPHPEVEPHPEMEPHPGMEPYPEASNETDIMEIFSEPEPPPMSNYYMPVLAGLAGLIGIMIIVENSFVLLALFKGKPRQPRSLTYFIANLAIADLVAGLQLIWFNCIDYFLIPHRPVMYTIVLCAIWLVTIVASIMSLFNFAIYRLKLAQTNVTFHEKRKTAVLMVLLSWVLPIAVLILPPLAGWNCNHCIGMEMCRGKCSQVLYPFTKAYALMLAVLVFLAVTGLFLVYLWMLRAVHHKVQKIQNKKSMQRKESAMIQTIILLLILFAICILPVAVILVIDFANTSYKGGLITAFQTMTILSFVNSVCNPFVYIWKLPSMNSALWKALGKNSRAKENTSWKSFAFYKKRNGQKSSPSSRRNQSGSDTVKTQIRQETVEATNFTTTVLQREDLTNTIPV